MKKETAEKLKKTFTDWKTYVFSLIPLTACVTVLILVLLQSSEDLYDAEFMLAAGIVVTVSGVLLLCNDLFHFLKYRSKRNFAAFLLTIAVLAAFLAVGIAAVVQIPQTVSLINETRTIEREYKETAENGNANEELHDAWRNAKDKSDAAYSKVQKLELIASALWLVGVASQYLVFKRPQEEDGEEQRENDAVLR